MPCLARAHRQPCTSMAMGKGEEPLQAMSILLMRDTGRQTAVLTRFGAFACRLQAGFPVRRRAQSR